MATKKKIMLWNDNSIARIFLPIFGVFISATFVHHYYLKTEMIRRLLLSSPRFPLRSVLSSRRLSLEKEHDASLLTWLRGLTDFQLSDQIGLQNIPDLGFDLVSKGSIPAGSIILSVPKSGWYPYSADGAIEELEQNHSQLFQSILKVTEASVPNAGQAEVVNIIRSCSLALQILRQVNSGTDAYLKVISEGSFPWNKQVSPHPLLLQPSQNLDLFLPYTSALQGIVKRQMFYKVFIAKLLQEGDVFPYLLSHGFMKSDVHGLDPVQQYLWAVGLILSRALSSESSPLSLVPYLDFTNHSSNQNALNCTHRFDSTTETFQLVANRNIESHESLRISYGITRSTESFLTLYGFSGTDVEKPDPNSVQTSSTVLPLNDNDWTGIRYPVTNGGSLQSARTSFQQVASKLPFPVLVNAESKPDDNQQPAEDLVEIFRMMKVVFQQPPSRDASAKSQPFCEVSLPVLLGVAVPEKVLAVLLRVSKSLQLAQSVDSTSSPQYTEEDIVPVCDAVLSAIQRLTPASLLMAFNYQAQARITSEEDLEGFIAHLESIARADVIQLSAEERKLNIDAVWKRSCAYYLATQLRSLQRLFLALGNLGRSQ